FGKLEIIAVDKIGVGAAAKTGEQRVFRQRLDLIPPHMRDLQRIVARLDRDNLPVDPPKSLGCLELAAAPRHHLHADANAEKRAPSKSDRFVQSGFETPDGSKTASAIGE